MFFSLSVSAQLGLSQEEYEKKFGACIDNNLPSPTGENWAIYYSSEYSCNVAVLLKDKKSIFIQFRREEIFQQEEKEKLYTLFEKGKWSANNKNDEYLFKSETSKIYCLALFGGVAFAYDKAFLQQDKDFQRLQKAFQFKRKTRFAKSLKKIESIGLVMTPEQIKESVPTLKQVGRETKDYSFWHYTKGSYNYLIRYNLKGKVSDKVTIKVNGFISSKLLEEIKQSISNRWTVYGDSLLSSDKKFAIVVKLNSLEIYYPIISAKYSHLSEAPTFHIGKWCPNSLKD